MEEERGMDEMKVTKELSEYNYTAEFGEWVMNIQLQKNQEGAMKAYITINDVVVGIANLFSQRSIRMLFKDFSKRYAAWDEMFECADDFVNKLLQIGNIISNKDYDIRIDEPELSEDDLGKARRMLGDKFLLERIEYMVRHSSPIPFVHEHDNLLLTILVIASSKSMFPIHLEFSAPQSTGKSFIPTRAMSAFPKEMIIPLSGATGKSLHYYVTGVDRDGRRIIDMVDKCIIIFEKDESYEFVKSLKPLMSYDNYIPGKVPESELWKVVNDPEVGEMRSVKFIIRGFPSVITMTTELPEEQQIQSRQIITSPSLSKRKIEASIKARNKLSSDPFSISTTSNMGTLHNAFRLLKKRQVVNVFATIYDKIFPMDVPERMRDHSKLLSLIDTIAIIHQYQRLSKRDDDITYIYATIEDNLVALSLLDTVLRATLTGIPILTFLIYDKVTKLIAARGDVKVSDILEYIHLDIKITMNELMKHIHLLKEKGLVSFGRGKSKHLVVRISKDEQQLYETYQLLPLFFEEVCNNIDSILSKIEFETLELPQYNNIEIRSMDELANKFGEHWEKIGNLISLHYFTHASSGLMRKIIRDEEVLADIFTDHNPFIQSTKSHKYSDRKAAIDARRIEIERRLYEIDEEIVYNAEMGAIADLEDERKKIEKTKR